MKDIISLSVIVPFYNEEKFLESSITRLLKLDIVKQIILVDDCSEDDSYLIGERGPEIFTPNSSGTVIPNNQIGGGGDITNITVNVDASESSVEGDTGEAQALGRQLATAIQTELIKQKRPGGLLA